MKQKTAYRLVAGALLILMAGANMPSPLYHVYMEKWHFPPSLLTLVFATYALVLIPSLLFFGRLSDKVGRRRILTIGLLIAAAGSFLFAMASGLSWLLFARAIQGLAVGLVSGAATAALVELEPNQDRRNAALAASVMTAGGTALGPLIAGVLAQYGPAPLKLPFLFQLLFLLPLVSIMWGIPETVVAKAGKFKWHPKLHVPRTIQTSFWIAAATAFLAWAAAALFMAVIPSYMTQLLHVTNLALTGGAVFVMLATSTLSQMVFRKLAFIPAIVSGILILIIGLVALTLAVPAHSLDLLAFGTLIAGLGQGLAFMGATALINSVASPDTRGEVLSAFYVIIYLGVAIPILGVGYAATKVGFYLAVTGFSLAVVVSGLITIFFATRKGAKSSNFI